MRVLRKAILPLNGSKEIDLFSAAMELDSSLFEVSYDPPIFPGMVVKVGKSTFRVFSNGKVMIYGQAKEKVVRKEIFLLWEQYLKRFLTNGSK